MHINSFSEAALKNEYWDSFHIQHMQVPSQNDEAFPGAGPVPLFSWNISTFSLVPQNQNISFVCSLLPQITFVLLFPSFLDLYSPFPLK